MKKREIILTNIRSSTVRGKTYRLHKPVEVKIRKVTFGGQESGYWIAAPRRRAMEWLGYGYGKTAARARNDLAGNVFFLYEEYGCCADDKMTQGARDLKKQILALVSSVKAAKQRSAPASATAKSYRKL